MATTSTLIHLIRPIPQQIVYLETPMEPVDLKNYFSIDEGKMRFQINDLPAGITCDVEGIVTGQTQTTQLGNYVLEVIVEDDYSHVFKSTITFIVQPKMTMANPKLINELKAQVWKALGENQPVETELDLFNRPITSNEIYYLLQRWGYMIIWNVNNVSYSSTKTLLNLEGASQHYAVWDKETCLVAGPKDLFSYKRTLNDAIITAKAMAIEVHKRNWTIEFEGFNKMIKAAWVQLQHLGFDTGKYIEVINLSPSLNYLRTYNTEKTARLSAR